MLWLPARLSPLQIASQPGALLDSEIGAAWAPSEARVAAAARARAGIFLMENMEDPKVWGRGMNRRPVTRTQARGQAPTAVGSAIRPALYICNNPGFQGYARLPPRMRGLSPRARR